MSYLFCNDDSALRSVPIYHLERAIGRTSLSHGVKLSPEEDLDRAADQIQDNGLSEFCWSLYFEPSFILRLLYAGFLPICTDLGAPNDPVFCLLPKLHEERCVVFPNRFHVHSKTRKRASRFSLSLDSHFDAVVEGCMQQHGTRSWLYRPLLNALRDLQSGKAKRPLNCPVSVHSVELWNSEGKLVAGEIGYCVGSIYTSMTGFHTESGSGSIQLAALAGLLFKVLKFTVWDLGMSMDYKLAMGAELIPRRDWIRLVRDHRQDPRSLQCDQSTNCRQLIDS